jgi:hypothetical protein
MERSSPVVLIVEDEPIVRFYEYEVAEAATADQAERASRQNLPGAPSAPGKPHAETVSALR